jgi:lysophospholipase L1-like esterase
VAKTRRKLAAAATAILSVGFVSAASRPADAASTAGAWTVADVFTASTPANPSSDAAGNPGVWTLAQGVGFDTGTYRPLTTYADTSCGFTGLRSFSDPSGLPSVGYNGTGRAIVNEPGTCATPFSIPAAGITVHPMANDVIVMWTSPVDGQVTITGRLFDADTNCGNGIGYRIGLIPAGGTEAVMLASGAFTNGGSSSIDPSTTTGVAVTKGSRIILGVDDEGDTTCDLTNADLTISTGTGNLFTWAAIGDSYSAGEGLSPYESGTATRTNSCHRSDRAYSQLIAPPSGALYRLFYACSGANVLPDNSTTHLGAWGSPNSGQVSPTEPAQVSYLNRDTDLVTMTLGGNALGWVDTLTNCTKIQTVPFHRTLYFDPKRCNRTVNGAAERIEIMRAKLLQVYREALVAAPSAQIRIMTYPPIFPTRSKKAGGCQIGRLNLPGVGTVDAVIAADTTASFVDAQQKANAAIVSAVNEVGDPRLRVVDVVPAFGGYSGHTVGCGDSGRPAPWINDMEISSRDLPTLANDLLKGNVADLRADLDRIYKGSFHPRGQGQQAMADALRTDLGW